MESLNWTIRGKWMVGKLLLVYGLAEHMFWEPPTFFPKQFKLGESSEYFCYLYFQGDFYGFYRRIQISWVFFPSTFAKQIQEIS